MAKLPAEQSNGSAPQAPWWASQGRQEQTVGGDRPKSKLVPVDPPSTAPPLARQPNHSAPPAELTQADGHSPAVKSMGPAEATRPEPSNLLGFAILSIITFTVLALKGLSLRRRKVRINNDYRQEPFPGKSSAPPAAPPADIIAIQPVADLSCVRADGDAAWIPFGMAAAVGRRKIAGPAYVGSRLPTSNSSSDHDNCLIDPSLPVGGSADTVGQQMNYWPSYGSMNPGSRLAFLNWMASLRNAPDTYIGYVFVYFYALERRAILERSEEDWAVIERELVRLLEIYGGNRSFHRYGTELLSAIQLLELGSDRDAVPVYEAAGGDIPASVKIAIGRRLRDNLPIEPQWLLSWTMSHPETRVKTPARRAFTQLKSMFEEECQRRFPRGLVLDSRNLPRAEILYRSASGTFVSDLTDAFGSLPDASGCSDALALGRNILDDCTEQLDRYSRRVAKAPEHGGSLHAIALLPPAQRTLAIKDLPNNPLTWLYEHVLAEEIVPAAQLFDRVNAAQPGNITSAKLRELAETLGKFGLGVVPGPGFSFGADHESILLFELDAPTETLEAASAHYRSALLTVALGILVGKADGGLQPAERLSLEGMVANANGVTENERRRLSADLRWLELRPVALASLRRKLAAVPHEERAQIADLLVGLASAGGSHERTEVALLERIYRQLNLDPERLYAGLHKATAANQDDEPVRLPGEVQPTGYAIPRAPTAPPAASNDQPRARAVPAAPKPVDRRAAIRAETEAAAAILADVFGAHETDDVPTVTPGNQLDALEPRLANLLQALLERESWPRADFDRLARELSLTPGAALENLNSWGFDRYDDLLLEDGDPIIVNRDIVAGQFSEAAE
ncbi:TerB N-terminal domain-containing protein [Bradyrhizobium sp.]|uniref:tellurite resistance TerB family protein n=1 Tax=Bradyrhizobium sp. TaxID=376 RepID=UPI0027223FDE|nr:TerB N-terminal domain-containing protein [Bradyrhizobium sp.]MDO9299046.1 TerB N-terminal domain-containing protein [Bradyrhizobium sp.]